MIVLALVSVSALLVRCLAIAEPLGIDQSLWASVVRGMSRGQLLYRDVWEQRPPGIYWIYLLGFQTLGWTAATVAWLDVIAATATTALLFAIGRNLADALVGATAAALFAALTMPAWLFGNGGFLERSVCETFILVCASAAAWFAVWSRDTSSPWPAAGIGLFAGAAVVLKPNAGLYFPAMLAWMVLYGRLRWRESWPRVAVACVASAVLPIAAFAWLWRLGLLGDARVAVIDFNRFYVAQGFELGSYAIAFSKAIFLRMKTDPLWTAGSIAALVAVADLARRRRLPPAAGLAVLWGGASAMVIAVNGAWLFNSYFIQAFAPLALLAAWLLAEAARTSTVHRVVAIATVVLMAVLLIQRGYVERVSTWAGADLAMLRGRIERTAYLERFGGYNNDRGYSARANEELAAYVRAHTAAGDRIFLFGINGAGIYFNADRLIAQRFLRANFFVGMNFPDPSFQLDAVTQELAARRPAYLIFEQLHAKSAIGQAVDALPQQAAVRALLDSYTFEARIEDFTLYRRSD